MTAFLRAHAERIAPRQFRIVIDQGWLPGVRAAAERHGVDAALLLAIGSRETNLDPKYLRIAGDGGHGYGLLQMDSRSYPQWINTGAWRIAEECFDKGGEELAKRRRRFSGLAGQSLKVRSLKGTVYHYVGAVIPDEATLERIVIASWNEGDFAYYHFSKGNDIDRGTTPGPSGKPDYSSDALARREVFKQLLATVH